MNIHLPAILRFTRGTRFWPIPILEGKSFTDFNCGWDTHWTHVNLASWMRQGRLKTESCPAIFQLENWKLSNYIIVLLIYPTMYVPIILYIYIIIHPLNACVWYYSTMFWTAHSLNSLWRAFDVVWLAYAWPPKRGEFRFSESDRGEFYQVLPKKLVYGVFGVTFEPGWSLQIFTVETTSQISMSFGSRDLQEPPPEFGAENVETPCVSTVNVLAIEDSYGKWPSSRCVTVFYHVFNHVYHVLPCRIYVLSMAYPYFPMCFTMCLPIKSSFFWLSHVLPEGHLAPGPAHRWHWSFTRSAQSPAIFQGNTASSSCFFFFRVHVSICFLHSEKGISMDILSFFCHKNSKIWNHHGFLPAFAGFNAFFGGHVEFSTDSQRPDL